MELIPHCLTPNDCLGAFVVWLSLVSSRPLAHPVPYLPKSHIEAVPKYISGRTSYLRVRLAFHPYPQLIPAFCTRHGFGPPSRDYRDFNLAMGRSPGFGSNPDNTPSLVEAPPPLSVPQSALPRQVGAQRPSRPPLEALPPPGHALFGLAFAMAPELLFLNRAAQINSPAHSSIGTRSSR